MRQLWMGMVIVGGIACSAAEHSEPGADAADDSSTVGDPVAELRPTTSGEMETDTTESDPAMPAVAMLGGPCTISEELPTYGGGTEGELNLGRDSLACASTICLGNHAQGRVGCPYGQDPYQPDERPPCTTPDGQPVVVPVAPQLVDRRADEHVYCSCRCDGFSDEDNYCTCPDGFSCEALIPELGLESSDFAGSYCIRAGSVYEPQYPRQGEVCSFDFLNCE